jgi:hypothetical protein
MGYDPLPSKDGDFMHSIRFQAYMIRAFPPKLLPVKKYGYIRHYRGGRASILIEKHSSIYISFGRFSDDEFAASLAVFFKANLQSITSKKVDKQQSFIECKMLVQQKYGAYLHKMVMLLFVFNSKGITERGIIESILYYAGL